MDQNSVNLTAGALLLGATFSWCLYGCLVMQFYVYYTTPSAHSMRPKDPTWLSCIVSMLCIVESGYILVMTHSVWVRVVEGWHTVNTLRYGPRPWTSSIGPTFIGLATSIVQMFLAWRIWSFSRMSRKGGIVATVIILFAITEVIMCLFIMVKSFQGDQGRIKLTENVDVAVLYFALTLVCDTIITVTMTILLRRAKDVAMGALNSRINGLIIKSFETGAVITMGALVSLLLFVCSPHTRLSTVVTTLVSKLYTMTLLASLNGRRPVTGGAVKVNNLVVPT